MATASEQADDLRSLADEVLTAFQIIADAARDRLDERRNGSPLDALASINQATSEKVVQNMAALHKGVDLDCRRLIEEPAIARVIVLDEGDRAETIFVTRGSAVDPKGVRLCSYLSAKGALASLPVGEEREIALPGGPRWFRVIERATFTPRLLDEWDARPAVIQTGSDRPVTVRSLRDLLRDAGVSEDAIEELERLVNADPTSPNVVKGFRHEIQTAMQLRVQAILDDVQSEIFRLPINSRLFLRGPAGTGKTTTLIKRLRQKIDWAHLDERERLLVGEENAAEHAENWLMFTPTELLKRYVQEAFNREDVPAPAGRIRTWTEYRMELARRRLPVLRSGGGSGLIVKDGLESLSPGTLDDQIAWYEAFDSYQQNIFAEELGGYARRLQESGRESLTPLGERLGAVLDRLRDQPLLLLGEMARYLDELQRELAVLREITRKALRQPLALHLRSDPGALDASPASPARWVKMSKKAQRMTSPKWTRTTKLRLPLSAGGELPRRLSCERCARAPSRRLVDALCLAIAGRRRFLPGYRSAA